jgi:hypothetical protein
MTTDPTEKGKTTTDVSQPAYDVEGSDTSLIRAPLPNPSSLPIQSGPMMRL